MRASSKLLLTLIVLAGAGGAYYYFGQAGKTAPAADAKPQRGGGVQTVSTTITQKRDVDVTVLANGYVSAINVVEVRPQVQNIVRQIHVKEGQDVKAGQLLFTLDERNDAANRDKVAAQVERDRADLADAEATLKRNQELFAKGFVAQAVVDTARAKVASLRGTLASNQAALQSGQVTLGFNRITASIAGRLGALNVRPGSLAQPGGTPLVTIAQMDPVNVSFAVPEAHLQHILTSYPKGDAPVTATLANGKTLKGKLVFIDNTVDQATGAIKMKAEFANGERLLWPGAFVNVSMVTHTLKDVVTLPPQAVVTGPNDKFVYLVQEEGAVKRQKVSVGAIQDDIAAVTGLDAGLKVVVEGAQNLRPNSKVREAGGDKGDKAGKGGNGGKGEGQAAGATGEKDAVKAPQKPLH